MPRRVRSRKDRKTAEREAGERYNALQGLLRMLRAEWRQAAGPHGARS